MESELKLVEAVSSDSLSLITKAEIDVQISTAKAFPRSLKVFQDRAMSMATFSEDIAAACGYSVPRAGKAVEGMSVRLAEIVCSAYGNIRAGARIIGNDGKKITAQGFCHDLETNNFVTVEIHRKITGKDGKTFTEDMQIVTGNAACAIAYRNAVFKVVPAALVEEVYERAKEVARGTAETLVQRRNKAVEYFRSIGIKDAQICEALGIKKIEDIDLDKLATLSGMKAALKNGETTARDLFEKSEPEKVAPELARITEMINSAETVEALDKLKEQASDNFTDDQWNLFSEKKDRLNKGAKK